MNNVGRTLSLLSMVMTKAWLAFAAVAFLGALVFAYQDRYRFLYSDDAYIYSALFGGVAAVLAAVHVSVRHFTGRLLAANVVCLAVLLSWCGLMLLTSRDPQEGIAASALAGLIAWPLFTFPLPRSWEILLSCLGGLFLLRWLQVAMYVAHHVFWP